jgi:hypothetical protein
MNMNFSQQEMKLAQEIAEALDDWGSLQLFLQFARQYKEEHLRKILENVMNVEQSNIRKTRGALFTHLVKNHGHALYARNKL